MFLYFCAGIATVNYVPDAYFLSFLSSMAGAY